MQLPPVLLLLLSAVAKRGVALEGKVSNEKEKLFLRKGSTDTDEDSSIGRQLQISKTIPFCKKISEALFQTVYFEPSMRTKWDASIGGDRKQYELGTCTESCQKLCSSYSVYSLQNENCSCTGMKKDSISTSSRLKRSPSWKKKNYIIPPVKMPVLIQLIAPVQAPVQKPLVTTRIWPVASVPTTVIDVNTGNSTKPVACGSHAFFNITTLRCECNSGYMSNDPSQGCWNINECKDEPTICSSLHTNSRCVDTIGSYMCVCMEGYAGDLNSGETCKKDEDEDEGEFFLVSCDNEYSYNPCGPEIICENTPNGGHKCIVPESLNYCPSGDCGPSMECKPKFNAEQGRDIYTCVCLPGYVQDQSYLPCYEP
jgi:Calcium-binding EGF domain